MADGADLNEYLEKVVETAFKREFEQDENVVRSLPFFATALGLAVAIFTQIASRLSNVNPVTGIILGVILAAAAITFAIILWSLFQLVRAREFKVPPNEESLVAWARDLRVFYRDQTRSTDKATELAEAEVRAFMVDAYAEAAVDNRGSNRVKFRYRAQGFTFLVILIALASLSVGVIYVDRQWSSLSAGASNEEQPSSSEGGPQRGNGSVPDRKADTAADPHRSTGGEVPRGSGGKGVTDVGREEFPAAATPSAPAGPSADGIREEKRS